jgi:molecular chaperone HtpG
LNISRETMQDSALMQKLNRVLTGKFLKFLEDQAEKDAAGYDKFYNEYHRFLKEGVATDPTHKESLGKLLRYESSAVEKGARTSLAAYVGRMPADQKEIFYILAPSREAAESSPYYEVFRARKLEVLFLFDPWDEFVMDHLYSFQEKPLRAAEKSELSLPDADQQAPALSDEEAKELAKWLKEILGDRIHEVRVSHRLIDSPAVIVDTDRFMTSSMRRILKAAGKAEESKTSSQDLEINPRHAIVTRLAKERLADAALAAQVAEQVFDNALVAAGLLEDPRTMLKRLNALLERVMTARP